MKLNDDTMFAIIECLQHDRDRFEMNNETYHIKRIDSLIDDLRIACGYCAVETLETA